MCCQSLNKGDVEKKKKIVIFHFCKKIEGVCT